MGKIIIDKIIRIIKNKKKLEEELKVKIMNRGKEVKIEGSAENQFIAEKVIEALNFGFPYSEAISIKKENRIFEKINIKEHTNKKNFERIRGRLIGKSGKVIQTIANLTESSLELKENQIGIITDPENLERITGAVIQIIQGAKHGNVYKGLEKSQPKPIYDLGLKIEE